MNARELTSEFGHFTGSENYSLIMPRLIITDGVQYVANQANPNWLITAIYSDLVVDPVYSEFVVASLSVERSVGDLLLDDGKDPLIGKQHLD